MNNELPLYSDEKSASFVKFLMENMTVSKSDCEKACEIVKEIENDYPELKQEEEKEMGGNYLWQLNHETRQIIDSVALEYDGCAIKKYLFKKGSMAVCMEADSEHKWADFKLNPDPYFLKSQLFGYQRYFGKWGGERVPEWDRDYSHWYFTYLQCYRDRLSPLFLMKDKGTWGQFAEKREEAAADLRKNFSRLGKDDLTDLSIEELDAAMRGDFTAACERGLASYIADRAMTLLANSCNHELILRLLDPECCSMSIGQDLLPMDKVDFRRIHEAFSQYINRGIVDADDDVNRVVYKMLQWFLTTHPGHAVYTNRSYILYGLMYLHLYRSEFSAVGGIPARVKKWRKESSEFREHWAAQFRQHLSILREASSMMRG